jgi:hypothetical protein
LLFTTINSDVDELTNQFEKILQPNKMMMERNLDSLEAYTGDNLFVGQDTNSVGLPCEATQRWSHKSKSIYSCMNFMFKAPLTQDFNDVTVRIDEPKPISLVEIQYYGNGNFSIKVFIRFIVARFYKGR